MSAAGGIASAGLFHPVILMVIAGTGTIIKNVVFPLVFFAAVLGLISHLASGFSISRLADFLRHVGLGIMRILTTIFLGVLTIQGVAGALVQPVGETQLADCLTALGNGLVAVFAVVAVTALLFFFALAVVCGVGNLTVMLR